MIEDRFLIRGWIIKEEQMTDLIGINLKTGIASTAGSIEHPGIYVVPDQMILMRCTGLPSKNGDLIYDGDRVSVHGYDGLETVEWDRGAYILRHHGSIRLLRDFNKHCTIAGNIYEEQEPVNELLKAAEEAIESLALMNIYDIRVSSSLDKLEVAIEKEKGE